MNAAQALLRLPEDPLNFGAGDRFEPRRVAHFLDLNSEDVSKIASVAPSSVRYDEKIPKPVVDHLFEVASIISMIAGYFNGDPEKTALWFKARNPMLGDVSPRDMVRMGRYMRLRKYIINAMMDDSTAAARGLGS